MPVLSVLTVPAVGACAAAVVVAAATMSMLEPVLALHLQALGINPARIGLVFGDRRRRVGDAASVVRTARRSSWCAPADVVGLAVSGCVLPLAGRVTSFESAVPIFIVQTAALALVIAPSLAYMGEATSSAGLGSFGVAYGLYNVAWGVGLLGGPALGGVLFERIGLQRLALWWAPAVLLLTAIVARVPVGGKPRPAALVAVSLALRRTVSLSPAFRSVPTPPPTPASPRDGRSGRAGNR